MHSKTSTCKIFRSLKSNVIYKIDVETYCLSKFLLQGMMSFLCQSHGCLTCHADPGTDAANERDIKCSFLFLCASTSVRSRLAVKARHGCVKREVGIRPVFIGNSLLLARGFKWSPNELLRYPRDLWCPCIICQQKNSETDGVTLYFGWNNTELAYSSQDWTEQVKRKCSIIAARKEKTNAW